MQQTPGRDVISLHAALMVKPATNIRWFVNENPHSRDVLHIVKNTSTLQERLEDIRWQQRPRSSMLGRTLEAIQTKDILLRARTLLFFLPPNQWHLSTTIKYLYRHVHLKLMCLV